MLTQDIRTKIVRTASFIALGGNLLLCVLKLTVGLISGSLSVLGDGIDTATEIPLTAPIARKRSRPHTSALRADHAARATPPSDLRAVPLGAVGLPAKTAGATHVVLSRGDAAPQKQLRTSEKSGGA